MLVVDGAGAVPFKVVHTVACSGCLWKGQGSCPHPAPWPQMPPSVESMELFL